MTAEQLRHIRENKGWTRDKMALELGGCTAQAIVKWERSERPIPAWVEEKLMRTVEMALPLTDIRDLIDASIEADKPFELLLAEAVREWLARRRQTKNIRTPMTGLKPTQKALEDTARVAEDETPYGV